jgi:hypothetical protein
VLAAGMMVIEPVPAYLAAGLCKFPAYLPPYYCVGHRAGLWCILKYQCGILPNRAETSFRNSLAARPGGRCFGQAATIFRCGFGGWSKR